MKSTKFTTTLFGMACVTGLNAYAMYLGNFEYTNLTIGIIAGAIGAYGGLKTYQNVALTNGNGGSE